MDILHRFTDQEGAEYELWAGVWAHIREAHPEIRTPHEIGEVLDKPDLVVRSNWSPTARLYYKHGDEYYRAVVVDVAEKRIKTAYLTDEVKSGEVLWSKT